MAKSRKPLTDLLACTPPSGCLIIFCADEMEVRSSARTWSAELEVHKINGEFLNHSRRDLPCDMYVCLKGSLDDV